MTKEKLVLTKLMKVFSLVKLMKAFSNIVQHPVLSHIIELYYPEYKLVEEVDENGRVNRNKHKKIIKKVRMP